MNKIKFKIAVPILLILTFVFVLVNFNEKSSIAVQSLSYIENLNLDTISKEDISNIKIVEKVFYSKTTVPDEYTSFFVDMLNQVDTSKVVEPVNDESNCLFKIYIDSTTDAEKFIIDVYGNDIISIYPWDGVSQKLFLSISELPLSIKAESLCNYVLEH